MLSNYRYCALPRIWQSAFFFSMLLLRLAAGSLSVGQPNSRGKWPSHLNAISAQRLGQAKLSTDVQILTQEVARFTSAASAKLSQNYLGVDGSAAISARLPALSPTSAACASEPPASSRSCTSSPPKGAGARRESRSRLASRLTEGRRHRALSSHDRHPRQRRVRIRATGSIRFETKKLSGRLFSQLRPLGTPDYHRRAPIGQGLADGLYCSCIAAS
jgi:hypothetical protein